MAPEDYQALSARRGARAQQLSERYPASTEVLRFYGALVSFQQEIAGLLSDWESLLSFREPLVELIGTHGSAALGQAALNLDEAACRAALQAYWEQADTSSTSSFFARVLLQPYAATRDLSLAQKSKHHCPHCGHKPQVGALRPQGEGSALSLICSLCPNEWPFESGRCVRCGEESETDFAYYTAPGFDHLRVQACDSCRAYHLTVDLAVDPAAVPEVDELTALPLDIWAQEQGFEKLQPNLAGI
jgi:FdhE protein